MANSPNMKKNRLLGNIMVCAIFLLGTGLLEVPAQETILASGGDASGNGGTASYSIGQVFCSVHLLTEGSITEGVQQPYEVYVISGIEDGESITLESRVYPNPVSGSLFLKVEHSGDLQLFYQLYDSNGRMLKKKRVTGNECMIPMEQYAVGIYYLHVVTDGKNRKAFKIIKR